MYKSTLGTRHVLLSLVEQTLKNKGIARIADENRWHRARINGKLLRSSPEMPCANEDTQVVRGD